MLSVYLTHSQYFCEYLALTTFAICKAWTLKMYLTY